MSGYDGLRRIVDGDHDENRRIIALNLAIQSLAPEVRTTQICISRAQRFEDYLRGGEAS